MANKSNLIPQAHKLTVEEQSKGGKKSAKSKKEKKYIRENLEELMSMDLKDTRLKENMRNLGVAEENMNLQNAISCAVVQQALYGNLKAFSIIVDMLQQNPKFGDDKEHIERNYLYSRYSYEAKRRYRKNKRKMNFKEVLIMDKNIREIPVVKVFQSKDGVQYVFWCNYCNSIHGHRSCKFRTQNSTLYKSLFSI